MIATIIIMLIWIIIIIHYKLYMQLLQLVIAKRLRNVIATLLSNNVISSDYEITIILSINSRAF